MFRCVIRGVASLFLSCLLLAGCTSSAPQATAGAAPPAPAVPPTPATPPVPAAPAAAPAPAALPEIYNEYTGVILRANPRQRDAEMMLFTWTERNRLTPFFAGFPVIGTDTNIGSRDLERIAVLYVHLDGYVPQGYEFYFNQIADFYPDLRPRPAGEVTPRDDNEDFGLWIEAELATGRVEGMGGNDE